MITKVFIDPNMDFNTDMKEYRRLQDFQFKKHGKSFTFQEFVRQHKAQRLGYCWLCGYYGKSHSCVFYADSISFTLPPEEKDNLFWGFNPTLN